MLILETILLCVLVMAFCLVFVNAVEAFGEQVGLSQTAAGSVLASLGTATPETLVPLIAILFVGGGGHGGGHGHDIGVGAILGAPFMLTTIALGVVGLTAAIQVLTNSRKTPYLDLEPGILRNFKFFFVFYPLAIIAALIGSKTLNYALGVFLLLGYAYFVWTTFKTPQAEAGAESVAATAEGELGAAGVGHGEEEEEEEASLWFNKIFRFEEPPVWLSVVQLIVGFVLMAYTIKIFADMLGHLSDVYGIPAAILSLVVAPLATELPEVGGASIFWTARKKDTLALGNITGAMVYQSSIAVCIGLFLTEWKLTGDVAASIIIALLSGGIIFGYYLMKKRLSAWVALLGCLFYIAYLGYIFTSGAGGVH